MLISSLFDDLELDDLAELLPESQEQLAQLERLAKGELDDLTPSPEPSFKGQRTVILEFFLDHDRAQEVNSALNLAIHRSADSSSRSDALVHVARYYLAAEAPWPTDSPPTDGPADTDG